MDNYKKELVFLGMEFGRLDGREWGYVLSENEDGTKVVLIDFSDIEPGWIEIFTKCYVDDRLGLYAGGDHVRLSEGRIADYYLELMRS